MTLEQAIAFAALLHEGQRDKAKAPYILHPLRVMARVQGLEAMRVAVLHDVMEDCGVTRKMLLDKGLPEPEVQAIEALSKQDGEHGGEEAYMSFIRRVAKNPLAAKVKLADLADNQDLSRFSAPTAEDRARVAKYERAEALLRSLTGA